MSVPPAGVGEHLPSWSELLRVWPVSVHAAALISLGWWARGAVDERVIELLLEQLQACA